MRLPHPVISVGSVMLGGSGKTPMTEFVVSELVKLGFKPAVLSRGYGRIRENDRIILKNAEADWKTCGDEPLLLARKLPGVPIVVHTNRYASGLAVADIANIYVLDDGFQHLRLARDLDIVLLTGMEFKTNLFPFGQRRDGLWRLRDIPEENRMIVAIPRTIDDGFCEHLLENVATVGFETIFDGLRQVNNWSKTFPLSSIAGQKVYIAAGIAKPERLLDFAVLCGAQIVGHTFFRDHFFHLPDQVASILKKAKDKGAEIILTTEKDAVRIEKFATDNMLAPIMRIATFDEFAIIGRILKSD